MKRLKLQPEIEQPKPEPVVAQRARLKGPPVYAPLATPKASRPIALYGHQQGKPGYYVSAYHPLSRQIALLVGPFDQHTTALAMIEMARQVAYTRNQHWLYEDDRPDEYSYGTVQSCTSMPGRLNGEFGLPTKLVRAKL